MKYTGTIDREQDLLLSIEHCARCYNELADEVKQSVMDIEV